MLNSVKEYRKQFPWFFKKRDSYSCYKGYLIVSHSRGLSAFRQHPTKPDEMQYCTTRSHIYDLKKRIDQYK